MIKSAGASKDDLPLDGSLEFYAVTVLVVIAAVAVWELLKKLGRGLNRWWLSSQRKREKLERLRSRAQAAVQEELRRYEPASDTPLTATRRSTTFTTTRRMSTSSGSSRCTRTEEEMGAHVRTIGTQTEPGPPMIPADRLEPYTGPFYTTPHGDRVHMTNYCHGQRSAMGASKRLELCYYCDRARGLYVLTAPDA